MILPQKAKHALQKSAALGSERAFKNQVRHCLRQLRSGPPHPCTISDSSRTQKQGVSTNTHSHTHEQRRVGAQLNRVRERGSGGQILKPHTPSRVTKVTKGMCKRLKPILLSTPAILSLQTGGKHTLAQKAFCNLFVHHG